MSYIHLQFTVQSVAGSFLSGKTTFCCTETKEALYKAVFNRVELFPPHSALSCGGHFKHLSLIPVAITTTDTSKAAMAAKLRPT